MPELTLNFGENGAAHFERLRRRLSVGEPISNGALVSAALSLLDWAVTEIECGRAVGSLNAQEKIFTSVEAPVLNELKRQVTWGTWNFLKDQAAADDSVDSEPPPG